MKGWKGFLGLALGLTCCAATADEEAAAVVEFGESILNGPGMQMIWVKPGRFTMGSPLKEAGRGHGEDQVEVELTKGFWLGATEVTGGQWTSVMERPGEPNPHGSKVPHQVAADKAMEFCERLTELEKAAGRLPEGYAYRLPTEAQWEYACRAGTRGPYAGVLGEMAWYRGDPGRAVEGVSEVAKKKPNAWGFYDMHGNVWEWCADWFDLKLQGGKDPLGPAAGKGKGMWYPQEQRGRVLRGGSGQSSASRCRSAARLRWMPAAFRSSCWGFRVALRPVVKGR